MPRGVGQAEHIWALAEATAPAALLPTSLCWTPNPPPPCPAPTAAHLQAFQIITHVQSHVQAHGSGSGLVVPAPQELPAGLFPSYRELCELMQDCWAKDPTQRPTFSDIVQRLRWVRVVGRGVGWPGMHGMPACLPRSPHMCACTTTC